MTFAVRDGTEGLYSDKTITDVELGETTGVRDVSIGNPITTVNGMIRVMASDASVTRLEAPQTICAGTVLSALHLSEGDAIQAGDGAVVVVGAVSSEASAISVKAPVYGWTSGRYALLSSPAAGLSFSIDGNPKAEISSEVVNGVTTYYATVAIEGEGDIVCANETLSKTVKSQIREYAGIAIGKLDLSIPGNLAIKNAYESGKTIQAVGPADTAVALISDMGIAPAMSVDETGALQLTYAKPALTITSFDPANGALGIKVTPGAGNTIAACINTAYVHVYGAGDLKSQMQIIPKVGFDMSRYLRPETKGEGVIVVTLGTHTFLKVKFEH